MAQQSLFWDAQSQDGVFDRTYSSDDFAAMFAGLYRTGVIPNTTNALLVEGIENTFSLVVNPGQAVINGRFYRSDSDVRLLLDGAGDSTRVDLVVLRLDKSKRSIYLRVLKGSEGDGTPTFAHTDSLYDLVLAKVTVPAAAKYLEDSMIEDMRGGISCPWAEVSFDMSDMVSQFSKWYESAKKAVDDSVASRLQASIDALQEQHSKDVASIQEQHSKDIDALKESHKKDVDALNKSLAAERKSDMVVKNGNLYIRSRAYDASIDTDIP